MTLDERRVIFRKGLSSLYLPIYDALCGLLPAEWAPFYGVRTFDQQTALYALGRSAPGKIVTNARAGESPHNYGCASDWTLWDKWNSPLWMGSTDPRWQVYLNAIEKAGGKAGFDFRDPPHNELPITCDWKQVLLAFQATNMTGAQQKIETSMVR